MTGPPPDSDEDAAYAAVIPGKAGKDTPYGAGPATKVRVNFGFTAWAREAENRAAWREIMERSGGTVTVDPFEDPEEYFVLCDAVHAKLGCLSMSKARRMGWSGWVDTREAIFKMYREMAELGMLPEMKVQHTKPMV